MMATGVLTPDQLQLVAGAFVSKYTQRPLICPVSGDDDWEIQDRLAFFAAGVTTYDGPKYPSAVILCRKCGYTLLINVFMLGVAEELGIVQSEASS